MNAIAHFNHVLAGMLQNVGHERPDVCHLGGQGGEEVGYVKVGGGQDCGMNKPWSAECVDEEPFVGEEEQNWTGEHSERARVLSPEPAKAAIEKGGQHEDLRMRFHHKR